jgi:hypothetical protein
MTPILTTGYSESPEKIADRMKRLNELHEQRIKQQAEQSAATMQDAVKAGKG